MRDSIPSQNEENIQNREKEWNEKRKKLESLRSKANSLEYDKYFSNDNWWHPLNCNRCRIISETMKIIMKECGFYRRRTLHSFSS